MVLEKKTLMSVFIAVIMIVSVIGFSLSFAQPAGEKLQYNSYTFVRTPQGLRTTLNDVTVYFSYLPRDLEDIEIDEGAKTAVQGAKVLWFTYDPQDEFAPEIADVQYSLDDALAKVADVYVMRALVNNTGYQLPVITCANASAVVPVILLQSGNETVITHQNGCVRVRAASKQEVYQVGDRLLYQLLGVMN